MCELDSLVVVVERKIRCLRQFVELRMVFNRID
jgi:hypothetical protein